jgi:Relaxase/Mobilisation nuclease domain
VIGKVCPRGNRVGGLVRYLYATGPAQQDRRGRRNPHLNPRIVAGFDEPAELEPAVGETGRRDFRRLVSLLEQPLVAAGVEAEKKPVYHLVVAARKDPASGELADRYLSDDDWRDIAETYMDRLGLARRGDDLAVRWVAVRHADDHVHIVATLARQDGRRVWPHNDFWRAGEASREVEAKYGLSPAAASDRTAAKRASYAETQKAARRGQREPARYTLRRQVRTAAAGASSLGEFLELLRDDGLLVRERHSERNPGEITGYAVALPESVDPGGTPIYFGGGKLAADLTLPKLRRRWDIATPQDDGNGAGVDGSGGRHGPGRAGATPDSATGRRGERPGSDRHRLTPQERSRIWEQATAAAARATDQVHTAAAGSDPKAAADAAWAAADFLSAAARVVEGRRGGPLTTASSEYDRAARELWGRIPEPSKAGQGLRTAAVLLTTARFVGRHENKQLLALLAQLAALTDAVTRLRENQHRAAQAAAARRAVEQLHLTSTQRDSVRAGSAAAGATRAQQAATYDVGRAHPGPEQGLGNPRRGPSR